MGNSSKKAEKTHKDHHHLRLRNAKQHILKNKSYIKSTFPVSSKEQLAQYEKSLKKPPAATTKNAFVPTNLKAKSGKCGSSAQVEAQYPPYWDLLSDQIKHRRDTGKNVQESEIWKIIYTLSETAKQYHKSNMKTGDIRPSNILLDDKGEIKLVTQHSWPEQDINYVKTLRNGEKTYLAPEEVKDINIGRNQQSTNIEDGEAFSIGLTAMDSVLLEESYDLYPRNGQMNLERLEDKRNRLRNSNFSNGLKAAILSMTDPNPDNRSVPGQIYDWLKVNQVEIDNMHTFNPSGSAPYGVSMYSNTTSNYPNYSATHTSFPQTLNRQEEPYSRIINYTTDNTRSVNTQSFNRPTSTFVDTQFNSNIGSHNIFGPPVIVPSSQVNRNIVGSPVNRKIYNQPVYSSTSNDYIFKNKPAPIIESRYLNRQTMAPRDNIIYRPSETNRVNLRDIYTSPEIVQRDRNINNVYIPKSQQKEIKRPTYDFGNNFNLPKYNTKPDNNVNIPQSSHFSPQSDSFVNKLKSNIDDEDINYNKPKVQTMVVNRGSKPEIATVVVEEDYPKMEKMSNWEIDREKKLLPANSDNSVPNSYQEPQQNNFPPPQIQEQLPYKPKMSYWGGDKNNHSPRNYHPPNSNIHVIHEASQEDSKMRSPSRQTPPKNNMQPIQSAYESQQQAYKISFFNNNRRMLPNQEGEQRARASSGRPMVASGYQRSPVLENQESPPRVMVSRKKKDHHDQEQNQQEIIKKMKAQTVAYRY